MKCRKCGTENDESSKFCAECGKRLPILNFENENKNKKIIILLIVIIAILFAVVLSLIGSSTLGVELQTEQFEGFLLDIPTDSKFVIFQANTTNPDFIFVGYENHGNYDSSKVGAIMVSNHLTEDIVSSDSELVEIDGDLKVYKTGTGEDLIYKVFKTGDDANITIMGEHPDILKRMAETFDDREFDEYYRLNT